ncbi:hypothetical protein RvY_13944 [Ramazzottius varieornatus]|uniref:Protein kinase domain-containing protein n=1 Tax=Ramazzottius varieornatus TaxID=947166 RepID=A0A1D1VRE3_RAMVA|nr:hypothetical protein RvY_13944 [Ramazzottius varieornatus]
MYVILGNRFYRQGIVEVRLLDHLRKRDTQNDRNVIHMLDCFHFRKHICIVLELAGINLYDLLKRNAFNGFSVMAVKRFAWNILQCLHLLQQEKIIHCDVKPENVLLRTRQGASESSIYDIKVTDFGSGCFIHEQVYCYIQSRYYRAPEIILDTAGNPTKTVNTRGKRRLPGTKSLQTVLKTSDRRFLDFMKRCLEWDPRSRVTADQLMHHEWMVGPPGKAAKDFPSFTSHGYRHTKGALGGAYEQRDVVAELLSTNPFNEENDPETRRPTRRREADRDE